MPETSMLFVPVLSFCLPPTPQHFLAFLRLLEWRCYHHIFIFNDVENLSPLGKEGFPCQCPGVEKDWKLLILKFCLKL